MEKIAKEERCIGKNCDCKSHVVDETKVNGCFKLDPVYTKQMRLSCPFCNAHGKPRILKSLFRLRYHFVDSHSNDADCQKIVSEIEQLLKMGVLRT